MTDPVNRSVHYVGQVAGMAVSGILDTLLPTVEGAPLTEPTLLVWLRKLGLIE